MNTMRRLPSLFEPRSLANPAQPGRPGAARLGLGGVLLLALSGCALSPDDGRSSWFEPYRIEVVQGNVVTREMAAQLRPGSTREQVRGLLGTPLLTDIFHADRWDYVFTIQRQGAATQQRRVTVFFDGNRMTRFEAGELPSEQEFVASIDVRRSGSRNPKLQLSEAELFALPLPAGRASAADSAASGPTRAYPPLEPVTR
jgi:outer membrane protein assembly factor BamE